MKSFLATQAYARWCADDGENKHYINHPLTEDSLAVFVGGYTGADIQTFWDRYHMRFIAFEPCKQYYDLLVDRFKDIPQDKYMLFNYGLSYKNEDLPLYLKGSSTSLYPIESAESIEVVKLRDIIEVFKELHLTEIQFIELNIEHAEFVLLPYMIENNFFKMFDVKELQIQFHEGENPFNDKLEMDKIRRDLYNIGYDEIYHYDFVWTSFSKNYERSLTAI